MFSSDSLYEIKIGVCIVAMSFSQELGKSQQTKLLVERDKVVLYPKVVNLATDEILFSHICT